MKTLLSHAHIITMDKKRTILEDGAVCVEEEKIIAVGQSDELLHEHRDAQQLDCRGCVVFPGFIEPMAEVGAGLLGKQFCDDRAAWRALRARFGAEASAKELRLDAELLARKTACQGITTIGVLYRNELAPSRRAVHQAALLQSGMRVLSFAEQQKKDPRAYGLLLDDALDSITPNDLADLLRDGGAYLLCVTPERFRRLEQALAAARPGARLILAGCHGLNFPQIRQIATKKFAVVYTPNTWLPPCHIVEMLHEKIPAAISSHGQQSRNAFDLFQTVRRAQLQNITAYDDYHILPFAKTLEMLTIESARALGIEDITGSLEAGKYADIIVVSWQKPHLTPNFMPLQGCMSRASGRDIQYVLAGGKVVKAGGRLVKKQAAAVTHDVKARWRQDV